LTPSRAASCAEELTYFINGILNGILRWNRIPVAMLKPFLSTK